MRFPKCEPGGLFLTRKSGEAVLIENDLLVQVVMIRGGLVRLRFKELSDKKYKINRTDRLTEGDANEGNS